MKNAQIALVAAALMGVAGAAAGQTEELVRTIPMEPGGRFSGDLKLTDVGGGDALTVRTVSGDIDIEKVRAPRLEVKSFSGAWRCEGGVSANRRWRRSRDR